MEKKVYEEPSVTKVEFDFNERIAASDDNQFGDMPGSCGTSDDEC